MNTGLIGRFYFKKTINDNLIGEFSNNKVLTIFTESADVITLTGKYTGEYLATWQENGNPRTANLSISYKSNTNDKIFSLVWKENGTPTFSGEAILCGDIIIGDYQD